MEVAGLKLEQGQDGEWMYIIDPVTDEVLCEVDYGLDAATATPALRNAFDWAIAANEAIRVANQPDCTRADEIAEWEAVFNGTRGPI